MATQDFIKIASENWNIALGGLFGPDIPQNFKWIGPSDITNTLSAISGRSTNHLFFPDGGGLDIDSVTQGRNQNCIEIRTGGGAHIINPVSLTFNKIGDELFQWSYFSLLCDELEHTGVSGPPSADFSYEPATELPNGRLLDRSCFEVNMMDTDSGPKKLPLGTREIHRYTKPSSFVIFCKASAYNVYQYRKFIGDSYDGRHNQMSESDFLTLIQSYHENIVLDHVSSR